MRHPYLYTHMLLQEANKQGRRVHLEWAARRDDFDRAGSDAAHASQEPDIQPG